MCPACTETMAMVVAGATSTGGLAAVAVKALRVRAGLRRAGTEPEQDRGTEP